MNNNLLAGLVIGAIVILGGVAVAVYGFPTDTTVTETPASDTSGTPGASGSSGTVTTTTSTTTTTVGVVPIVQTVAASLVVRTTAKLNGLVTPGGVPAAYWFEYGVTTSLGSTTSLVTAGSGAVAGSVSQSISSLKPSTKYYFRINAQNTNGTTRGAIASFITLP